MKIFDSIYTFIVAQVIILLSIIAAPYIHGYWILLPAGICTVYAMVFARRFNKKRQQQQQ